MKKTSINLSNEEFINLQSFIKTRKKTGKELERAYILMSLHRDKSYKEIEDFYYVNRSTIWRITNNYKQYGIKHALEDKSRPGQPKKYTDKQEAEIIALACSKSPKGTKRWTVRLLTEYIKKQKSFETINRETVRLILKKTKVNLG